MPLRDAFIRKKGEGKKEDDSKDVPKSGGSPVFGSSRTSSILTTPNRPRFGATTAPASEALRRRVEEALSDSTHPAYLKFMERFILLKDAGLENSKRYQIALMTTDGFTHDQVKEAVVARLNGLSALAEQLDIDVQNALDSQTKTSAQEAQELDSEIENDKAEIARLTERLTGLQVRKNSLSSTQAAAMQQIHENENLMKAAFAEVRYDLEQLRTALLQTT